MGPVARHKEWLEFMEGIPMLVVVLSLVCAATALMVKEIIVDDSLTSDQPPPTDDINSVWYWVDKIITLLFWEVFFRMYLYVKVDGDLWGFFESKLNWLDLGLVLLDIIFFMLPVGNLAKPLRLARIARL